MDWLKCLKVFCCFLKMIWLFSYYFFFQGFLGHPLKKYNFSNYTVFLELLKDSLGILKSVTKLNSLC